jgi:hypothetical protein
MTSVINSELLSALLFLLAEIRILAKNSGLAQLEAL